MTAAGRYWVEICRAGGTVVIYRTPTSDDRATAWADAERWLAAHES
jgi:hypothetical protein